MPRQWQLLDLDASTAPFLAIELQKGDVRFSFFTVLASLGTPYDITLHGLRIECFFAADAATDEAEKSPPPEPLDGLIGVYADPPREKPLWYREGSDRAVDIRFGDQSGVEGRIGAFEGGCGHLTVVRE